MNSKVLEVFKLLAAKKKNAVISPYCIDILFGIVHTGTRGSIKSQFGKLINTDRGEYDLASIKEEIEGLNETESICKQSNQIYHKEAIRPVSSFIESVNNLVDLEVGLMNPNYKFDFEIRSKFNIAVKWKEAFDKVPFGVEPFILASGDEMPVEYISMTKIRGDNEIKYFDNTAFRAVQIPMTHQDLFLEIYLPHEKTEYRTLVENLNGASMLNFSNQFSTVKNLEVVLPKFAVEFKTGLKEELISLGFSDLFKATYDFDPMLSCDLPLEILGIDHETGFKLDEYGIAGNASSVLYGGISGIPPKEKAFILFEANHPFLYVLRNVVKNEVLFIGGFEEPLVNDLEVNERQKDALNRSVGIVRRFKPEIFSLSIRAKAYLGLTCLNNIVGHSGECPDVVKAWVKNVLAIISEEQEDLGGSLEKIYFGDGSDITGYFEENDYFDLETFSNFKSKYALIYQGMELIRWLLYEAKILIDPDWFFGNSFRSTIELLELLVEHKIEIPQLDLFKTYQIVEEDILGELIVMDDNLINHLI